MSTELHSLRDIEGVYGSFIVNANGETIARDLPPVFDDHTLAESGERIVRLWAVLSESSAPEYALIEFAEYSLFIRELFVSGLGAHGELAPAPASGCLCIVIPPNVNMLSLRLASKWVARSVSSSVAGSPPQRVDREPTLAASA
jgi:hypothetical protein